MKTKATNELFINIFNYMQKNYLRNWYCSTNNLSLHIFGKSNPRSIDIINNDRDCIAYIFDTIENFQIDSFVRNPEFFSFMIDDFIKEINTILLFDNLNSMLIDKVETKRVKI